MDAEGAGWLDLSDIPAETLLELELGLFNEGALWGISHPNTLPIKWKMSAITDRITIQTIKKGGQKWLTL